MNWFYSCALLLQHFRPSLTHPSWYLEIFNILRFYFFNISNLDHNFKIQIPETLHEVKNFLITQNIGVHSVPYNLSI